MNKKNGLLTLFIAFVVTFLGCQQSEMPVESNMSNSTNSLQKTVSTAVLKLNVLNVYGEIELRVHKLDKDWVESEVTWNDAWAGESWNYPATDPQGGNFDETEYVSQTVSAAGELLINVKDLWKYGVPPYGLIIKVATPTGKEYVKFSSREGGPIPVVEVTYTDAPGQEFLVIGDSYIWGISQYENTNMHSFKPTTQVVLYAGMVGENGEKRSVLKFEVPELEEGCTLTQGYWKTHAEKYDKKGKLSKKYDATWGAIEPWNGLNPAGTGSGSISQFYYSGDTYIGVLNTPSKDGNAYIILAYQFIAAELNRLNGASAPTEVIDAFNTAKGFFENPANNGEAKEPSDKQLWIDTKDILDDYNNGLIGPGHCDD